MESSSCIPEELRARSIPPSSSPAFAARQHSHDMDVSSAVMVLQRAPGRRTAKIIPSSEWTWTSHPLLSGDCSRQNEKCHRRFESAKSESVAPVPGQNLGGDLPSGMLQSSASAERRAMSASHAVAKAGMHAVAQPERAALNLARQRLCAELRGDPQRVAMRAGMRSDPVLL